MQTLVAEILAVWRLAERLSGELEPGTAERAAAGEVCTRLRDLDRDPARVLLAELAANR